MVINHYYKVLLHHNSAFHSILGHFLHSKTTSSFLRSICGLKSDSESKIQVGTFL